MKRQTCAEQPHFPEYQAVFAGFEAASTIRRCRNEGTDTITQVMQRKTLPLASGEELLIRYSGIDPQKPVAGIINEDSNNSQTARTDLARMDVAARYRWLAKCPRH
ncbi:MAG: hypothetical protein IPP23_12485 [Sphingomonadales bacterium]|nr:hypothetical protein [Sphingomonadales bacterium]